MNIFRGPKFVDFLGKILGFSKQFFLVGPLGFLKPLDQKLLIFQQKALKNLLKEIVAFAIFERTSSLIMMDISI